MSADSSFNWNKEIAKREKASGFQLSPEDQLLKALFCNKSGLRKERKALNS